MSEGREASPKKPCPDGLKQLCKEMNDWCAEMYEWAMAVHNHLWPGGAPNPPDPPPPPPFDGD